MDPFRFTSICLEVKPNRSKAKPPGHYKTLARRRDCTSQHLASAVMRSAKREVPAVCGAHHSAGAAELSATTERFY